jgi:hypothetical protein
MKFVPSSLSYGGDVDPETEEVESTTDYLQYLPFVRELVAGSDPEVEAEKTRNLLKQKKKTLREQPWQAFILNPQIASLEGKLLALDRQAADARDTAATYRAGQILALFGLAAGISVLFGGGYLLLQKARLTEAQREAIT